MKIAIEGCCHGELENIYETLLAAERETGTKVDLLLICGDFQACRNKADLETMSCPDKYKSMCSYYKYYSGEKEAPVTTIFIGGNHEASSHLWELPYGGWVAKNIFYLGYAGVVNFGGLRIGGISGIYNYHHYHQGHYEMPPFNDKTVKSAYHIREFDVFQLKQISGKIDIFLSHDWPRGIAKFGDLQGLLRKKQFLKREIEENSLGSPPGEELLYKLRPKFWFSAHLHVKYAAVVPHEGTETKFLALDKCLPRRDFLQILDFPDADGPKQIEVDTEWLAILRSTIHMRSSQRAVNRLPKHGSAQRWNFTPTQDELDSVRQKLKNLGSSSWPTKFAQTVEAYNPNTQTATVCPPTAISNPQMKEICDAFELLNICSKPLPAQVNHGELHHVVNNRGSEPVSIGIPSTDPNEIALESSDDDEDTSDPNNNKHLTKNNTDGDPNEISLSDDE